MTDRRNARATRLLDPTWHKMQAALGRLYAEIEPDAKAGALNVTVDNPDGTVVCYAVMLDEPGPIQRYVLTDERAVVEAMEAATVNATVGNTP